jgi:hypothetical protein
MAIWKVLFEAAASRLSFWAILAATPVAAMLHFRGSAPAAAASWMAFAFPAALCLGWSGGETRRSLALALSLTRAGSGPLLAAELAISTAGGALLALLPLSALPGDLPWQIWATAPLESLSTAALILWLEPRHRVLSGLVILLLASLSFAPGGRGLPALLAIPGFAFKTFMSASGGSIHPDAYLALALLFSAGGVVLAVRRMRGLGRA